MLLRASFSTLPQFSKIPPVFPLISESRIERIAQAITHEIVRDDGEKDRETGKYGKPPGVDVIAGVVQHATPCDDGWRYTEAQEGEAALDEDGTGDTEGGSHEHRSERIRKNMTEHDATIFEAKCCCGGHEVHITDAQEFAACESCGASPAGDTDQHHDEKDRSMLHHRNDRDNKEEGRQRDHNLNQS